MMKKSEKFNFLFPMTSRSIALNEHPQNDHHHHFNIPVMVLFLPYTAQYKTGVLLATAFLKIWNKLNVIAHNAFICIVCDWSPIDVLVTVFMYTCLFRESEHQECQVQQCNSNRIITFCLTLSDPN